MDWPYDSSELPRDFWSVYSDKPFAQCFDCGVDLQSEAAIMHVIQKHVVAQETVFELAMCIECASRLQSQFSVESRAKLAAFVKSAPEVQRRQEQADRDRDAQCDLEADPDGKKGILVTYIAECVERVRERAMSCCGLCGTPRSECHRYSMGTGAFGAIMLIASPESGTLGSPFVICETCERELNECISQQTRDAWDRFMEENFDDGPPGLVVDPSEFDWQDVPMLI